MAIVGIPCCHHRQSRSTVGEPAALAWMMVVDSLAKNGDAVSLRFDCKLSGNMHCDEHVFNAEQRDSWRFDCKLSGNMHCDAAKVYEATTHVVFDCKLSGNMHCDYLMEQSYHMERLRLIAS